MLSLATFAFAPGPRVLSPPPEASPITPPEAPPPAPPIDCYNLRYWDNGIEYTGNVSWTLLGLPCLPWKPSKTFGHIPGSKCRSPNNDFPWCFVNKSLVPASFFHVFGFTINWAYCDIPECGVDPPPSPPQPPSSPPPPPSPPSSPPTPSRPPAPPVSPDPPLPPPQLPLPPLAPPSLKPLYPPVAPYLTPLPAVFYNISSGTCGADAIVDKEVCRIVGREMARLQGRRVHPQFQDKADINPSNFFARGYSATTFKASPPGCFLWQDYNPMYIAFNSDTWYGSCDNPAIQCLCATA